MSRHGGGGLLHGFLDKMKKFAIWLGLGSLFGVAAAHAAGAAHVTGGHAAATHTATTDGGQGQAIDTGHTVQARTPVDQVARAEYIANQQAAAAQGSLGPPTGYDLAG